MDMFDVCVGIVATVVLMVGVAFAMAIQNDMTCSAAKRALALAKVTDGYSVLIADGVCK